MYIDSMTQSCKRADRSGSSCCSAINKEGKPCGLKASKNGLCHIHFKDSKEMMYKKELRKMHERVRYYNEKIRTFHRKLEIIDRMDFIKMRLIEIAGPSTPFKDIIIDRSYEFELEDLFDVPFSRVRAAYNNLLNERNKICHKYTMRTWHENLQPV